MPSSLMSASMSRCRGDSMITSCAPMPFILSKSPSPWRSSVPSTRSTGNWLGTTRRFQPGMFGAAAVVPHGQQLGRRHLLVPLAERTRGIRARSCTDSRRKSVGRLRRSVEMMTQRPVTGSLRSSDIRQSTNAS